MRVALIVIVGVLILLTLPTPTGHSRQSARLAMQHWIIQNVPHGTKLCYAGRHTNGPRLVSSDIDGEAANDYFSYRRNKNPNYLGGFVEAHGRYALSGRPLYNVANWGRRDAATPEGRAELLAYCRRHGSEYLVLGGIPPFDSLPRPLASGGGIFVFKL